MGDDEVCGHRGSCAARYQLFHVVCALHYSCRKSFSFKDLRCHLRAGAENDSVGIVKLNITKSPLGKSEPATCLWEVPPEGNFVGNSGYARWQQKRV